MTKYIVKDTVPALVSFNYAVEANSPEDAVNLYNCGVYQYKGLEVGDLIDIGGITAVEVECDE